VIRYLQRLWYRLFPPVELSTEEWKEVRDRVYQDFRDRQQDLATPLLAAIKKAKEEA